MTPDEQENWLSAYEKLPPLEVSLIQGAYKEATRVLSWDARFVPLPLEDERAEELIAVLTKYYMEGCLK